MNLIYREITKIRRRQRNIKGRLSKLIANWLHMREEGRGGEWVIRTLQSLKGGSDKFFRDTNKILQTPPPPPGINNDRFLIITCVYMILSFVRK